MGGGPVPFTVRTQQPFASQSHSIPMQLKVAIHNLRSQACSPHVPSLYPSLHHFLPAPRPLSPPTIRAPPLPPLPHAYAKKPTVMSRTLTQKQYVRLIYAKSGFHMKPQSGPDIHGFLAIVSNHVSEIDIYVCWIPEHLIDTDDLDCFITLDGCLASENGFPNVGFDMSQKEILSTALLDIHSLYVCPPEEHRLGSIIITTREGEVLPPLWFKQYGDAPWPGYDILDILGAFASLKTSPDDIHSHLVIRSEERVSDVDATNIYPTVIPTSSGCSSSAASPADPLLQAIRNTKLNVLEHISHITRVSRDTAAQVLDNPITRQILPLLPPSVQAMSRSTAMQETLKDYDRATLYLAQWGTETEETPSDNRWRNTDTEHLLRDSTETDEPTLVHTRRQPVSPEEWVDMFDDEGKLRVTESYLRTLVFRGGLHPDIRIEAWKFLLSIYPWDSTFDEREAIRRSRIDEYYDIKARWFNDPEVRVTKEFLDEKHRIDKDVHRTDRMIEFFEGEDLPNPDPDMPVGTNANLEIMKDILVTYNFHNTELGYVQGMSDLLAPLFVAMGTEEMAFWGFVKFMDRVQSNFFKDQSGMRGQLQTLDALIRFMDPTLYKHFQDTETSNLFFCFRWLLVWFKREFKWEDVIRLWEVLWTGHLSSQMILFVALAILDKHRDHIISTMTQFDEVLRFINDLSGHIDLEETLERAEVLFYMFERRVNAMDRKRAELIDKLKQRAVWNSDERPKIEDAIQKLKIDINLRALLKAYHPSTPSSSP